MGHCSIKKKSGLLEQGGPAKDVQSGRVQNLDVCIKSHEGGNVRTSPFRQHKYKKCYAFQTTITYPNRDGRLITNHSGGRDHLASKQAAGQISATQ